MQSKQDKEARFKASLKHLFKCTKEQGLRNTRQRHIVLTTVLKWKDPFFLQMYIERLEEAEVKLM